MSLHVLTQDVADSVLRRLLRKGGDFAELFAEDRRSLSLRLEDRQVEEVCTGVDRGASLRLIQGKTTYFGYTESLDVAAIEALADRLSAAGEGNEGTSCGLHVVSVDTRHPVLIPPSTVDVSRKADVVRLADETARSDRKEVRQVVASYSDSAQEVLVANSQGTFSRDERTRVVLSLTVAAERNGAVQSGRKTIAHHGGYELLEDAAVRRGAERAADAAVVMLDAGPSPARRMPVILAGGSGGVLFHEACGHGLEADFIAKGTSVWCDMLGEQVAPPFVQAYDDGIFTGGWGSATIDDEGTPCQRTTLIENGVLTSFLTDVLRSDRLGFELTGNGRRESFRHIPYPRMTNTYFGPGDVNREDLIADTANGLYARSIGGGQVDPATGDFVFGVSEGYMVESGKITAPVKGATLVGNSREVLRGLDAVCDDLELEAGMCGKEGQSVPVGSGQPTVRLRELTVGGTET